MGLRTGVPKSFERRKLTTPLQGFSTRWQSPRSRGPLCLPCQLVLGGPDAAAAPTDGSGRVLACALAQHATRGLEDRPVGPPDTWTPDKAGHVHVHAARAVFSPVHAGAVAVCSAKRPRAA